MKYYIIDTTLKPQQNKFFDNYNQIVSYLEGMLKREGGQTRNQRMLMLESLGHGYDDSGSVNFVRHMAEKYNMGVLRNAGGELQYIRCDVSNTNLFNKSEFGN